MRYIILIKSVLVFYIHNILYNKIYKHIHMINKMCEINNDIKLKIIYLKYLKKS